MPDHKLDSCDSARANPVCVKWLVRRRCLRALGRPVARGDRVVVALVSGSGVTSPKCRFQGSAGRAGFRVAPDCPPGPRSRSAAGVGSQSLVDGVADPSFEAAHRFFAGLPFGLFVRGSRRGRACRG